MQKYFACSSFGLGFVEIYCRGDFKLVRRAGCDALLAEGFGFNVVSRATRVVSFGASGLVAFCDAMVRAGCGLASAAALFCFAARSWASA